MAKKKAEEKKETKEPADRYLRLSPGVYRDTVTGKLVKSAQDPDKKTSSANQLPKPAAPVQNTAAPAAQPTTITAAPPLPPAAQQEQTVTGATSPLTEALSSTQSTSPAPAAAAAPVVASTTQAASGTSAPVDRYLRLSPGVYRDTVTGKLVKSAQDPDRKAQSSSPVLPNDQNPQTPQDNIPLKPVDVSNPTAVVNAGIEAAAPVQNNAAAPVVASTTQAASNASAPVDRYIRLSPGVYRDTVTGKLVRSAQDPDRKAQSSSPVLPNDQNPQTPQDNIPLKPVDVSNPTAVVNAGIEANVGVAQKSNEMNNANQDLTYGKQTVTFDENGRPTITQERSAPEEQKYQQDVGIETSANQRIQDALSNYESLFSQPFDVSADRKRVEDQIYGRNKQLLDEQFQQSDEEFEQSLAQRGIPPGSPLENQMRQQYARQKADAYAGARNDAISQGRTEQAALSGLDLQRRQQGMSEMSGLYGLGMGVRDQQFQGFQGQAVTPVDAAGTLSGYYKVGQDNQLRRNELAQQNQQFNQTFAENKRRDDKKLEDYKAQGDIDWANDQRKLDWVKNNQPKSPGAGAAVANIIGNAGAGFMNGLGNSLGKSIF